MGIRWANAEAIPQVSTGDAFRGSVLAIVTLAGVIGGEISLREGALPGPFATSSIASDISVEGNNPGAGADVPRLTRPAGTPLSPPPVLPDDGVSGVPAQAIDTNIALDATADAASSLVAGASVDLAADAPAIELPDTADALRVPSIEPTADVGTALDGGLEIVALR